MELRILKYFLVIASEQNITKAANLLHVSQPTLSRQLMQIEEELGVKLFRRSRHNIVLTEEGTLLKRRAQEISDLVDKAEKELSQDKHIISGEISIGCGETKNMHPLSQWIVSFREKYPDVTFDIYTGIADDIHERIKNGILDFGLLLDPVELSEYNFVRMPLRERWCVLLRRESPLAEKDKITPTDLLDIPVIIAKRKSVRNEIENWFGELYQQIHVVATCNSSYSNRAIMVQNHIGVAFVHEFDNCPEDCCLRPIYPEIVNGSVLGWKKNQVYSPAMAEFIKHIKSNGSDMAK